VQSMNNVVMWRTDRWTLVDAGRVKVVDNDTGFHGGHAFTWDRYATWATLQRKDGAVVSVVSTHMPTNPAKFPRQPGRPSMTRVERYTRGMDVLVNTVRTLAEHGPVLLGGDMNSHHSQGAWTAAAKMTAAGYEYVKDRGVMHLFYQGAAQVVSNRQVGVASDHPAIITTLDMNGLGPS
jgi:endonuclease/exonuclease/phosphatase family metal-dependent hydrolase